MRTPETGYERLPSAYRHLRFVPQRAAESGCDRLLVESFHLKQSEPAGMFGLGGADEAPDRFLDQVVAARGDHQTGRLGPGIGQPLLQHAEDVQPDLVHLLRNRPVRRAVGSPENHHGGYGGFGRSETRVERPERRVGCDRRSGNSGNPRDLVERAAQLRSRDAQARRIDGPHGQRIYVEDRSACVVGGADRHRVGARRSQDDTKGPGSGCVEPDTRPGEGQPGAVRVGEEVRHGERVQGGVEQRGMDSVAVGFVGRTRAGLREPQCRVYAPVLYPGRFDGPERRTVVDGQTVVEAVQVDGPGAERAATT